MLGHALRDMYNVQVGLKNRWPEKQKRFATEEMQSHNSSPYPCFKRRYVGAGAHLKSQGHPLMWPQSNDAIGTEERIGIT